MKRCTKLADISGSIIGLLCLSFFHFSIERRHYRRFLELLSCQLFYINYRRDLVLISTKQKLLKFVRNP